MARPLRIEYPGTLYHNARGRVFPRGPGVRSFRATLCVPAKSCNVIFNR